MSASTTKTKNQTSRKPVLLDYLYAFSKDLLFFAARQRCILFPALAREGERRARRGTKGGHSLSQKRMAPFKSPKRKVFDWQSRARMTIAPPE